MAFVQPPRTPLEAFLRAHQITPQRLLNEVIAVTGVTWHRNHIAGIRKGTRFGSPDLREAIRACCARLSGRDVAFSDVFPQTHERPGASRAANEKEQERTPVVEDERILTAPAPRCNIGANRERATQ